MPNNRQAIARRLTPLTTAAAMWLIALPAVAQPAATATVTPTPTVRCVDPTPGNVCIPGGGSKTTDCNLEWVVTPLPTLTRRGIPKNRTICYEGDRRCDIDSDLTNQRCTFDPRLCINNADARFPDCVASDIATFEVKKPRPTSIDPTDMTNVAALEGQAGNASGGFGLIVVRKKTPMAAGTPNPTPDLCGAPINLLAPLREANGSSLTRRTTTVKVQGTTSLGTRDTDTLKLECRPSTCGNGVIEADHETCDDGNRTNGDGCDQGCQLERFGVDISGQNIAQPEVVSIVTDLHAAWVRVNLTLDGTTANDQNFKLFLDAGVNLVVTFNNRNPGNADTTYGSLSDRSWLGAGFPFLSKAQYQQDIRDSLAPVLSLLGSGRVWVQCENEVSDASVNPNAAYWRGTTDQYLTQVQAFSEVVRSLNPSTPVVLTSFASETLSAAIDDSDFNHTDAVNFMTALLTHGSYDAVDLHFYGCIADIPTKVQWVKQTLPAGKRWISTENGGPDYRCSPPIHWWDPNFETVEAQQVSQRLAACADNGGTACLWFALFDLPNSPEPFTHLGLLDQSQMPPRQKPAYDAFKTFAAAQP